ncbi:MAG: TraR/DksA family transcriptional regulator [Acidobacteria bacterium]|nr:TraR/DksA family transcriptional regulator [Acidobacteriota bacterium]
MPKPSSSRLSGYSPQMYRTLLLNKKSEFLVALGINFRHLAETQNAGVDPEQLLHEESLRLRLNRVLYNQLRQVEAALDRLDRGEYGDCPACGAPIAPKRLQAVPWAKYCLVCQERISSLHSAELVGVGEGD